MSGHGKLIMLSVVASIAFVVVGCVWLSVSNETLDRVAECFGASESPIWAPPLPDYELPGFEGNIVVNIAIGIMSTMLVLVVTLLVGKALKARR